MADADTEHVPVEEAGSGDAQEQVSAAESVIEAPPAENSIQEQPSQDGNDAEVAAIAEAGAGDEHTNDDGINDDESAVNLQSNSEANLGAGIDSESPSGAEVTADAAVDNDPDAAAKAAAAEKIQRIGRGRIVRKQDRAALAASSTVTKAEAREERQRQIAERKAKAGQSSGGAHHARDADAADAAPPPQAAAKKAATLDDIIDLAPLLSKPELGEWNRDLVAIEHAVTFDVVRRGNLKMIDENTVLSVCGSRLLILDITTMSQRFFATVSGRGVGCVAVHPNRTVFAVGEKGDHPFIVMYVAPAFHTLTVQFH
jgi:hypothetical protein